MSSSSERRQGMEEQNKSPKKWEYLFLAMDEYQYGYQKDVGYSTSVFDNAGQDGWELVTVYRNEAIFKRPL